jgi:hypothetical protein
MLSAKQFRNWCRPKREAYDPGGRGMDLIKRRIARQEHLLNPECNPCLCSAVPIVYKVEPGKE